MTRLTLFLISVAGLLPVAAFSQDTTRVNYIVLDTMYEKHSTSVWYVLSDDTMVKATYSPVEITSTATHRHKKTKYDKLQKKVIKVYPYAHAAGDIMDMYTALCQNITDEKEQRRLLDIAEDEMKKQFEADLRNLTVSEGIILIKLIDRETGNTSFKLVQELKGRFSAFMWQSVARLFGHDLKSEYDPEGDDVWIETTCEMIENGTIPVQLRDVDPFGMKKLAQGQ